jgi:hypothetical protein
MFTTRRILFAAAGASLAGCGTHVPDIQEFWGTPQDATFMVNKVSAQVVCELRRAVQRVVLSEPVEFVQRPGDPPPPKRRDLRWFVNTWAVQVTLNYVIIENSALTPGVSLNTVYRSAITTFPGAASVTTPQSFALGLGGTASSAATRTDKLNMFFTVRELLYGTDSISKSCIPNKPANADLFIQSDLKIYDWLSAALLPYDISIINYANNSTAQNAITHDVKFEIVSSGNINPQWKLVQISANTSPALLAGGRDRTQELIITFGPTQKGMLAGAASNSHQATEIGSAVSQAIQALPAR